MGWLLSPGIDLLCIANLLWPLLILWQSEDGFSGRAGLQFWQVYYVTTPHRWITLALVFLDQSQFAQRRGLFLGVLGLVVALCGSVWVSTGTLTCLLTIDYLWNAWHFAAQHHGVYRLYQRQATRQGLSPGFSSGSIAKWALRLFLLYVTLRVAGVTWTRPVLEQALRWGDGIVCVIPCALLIIAVQGFRRPAIPGMIYLTSVISLYSCLLWAVHTHRLQLALALTTASALFHALEYLAVVGWSVQQRAARPMMSLGILGWLAPRWGLALMFYLVILGSGAWLMDQWWIEFWLLLNVMAAFLHYAYDGLIWGRPRRPSQPILSQ